MRGWRKLRGLLLAVGLLAVLCVSAAAITDPVLWTSKDGLYTLKLYEADDGGLSVSGWSTEETTLGDLVIPSEVNGVPVTEIGGGAFYNCKVFHGELVLPGTVVKIGNKAFENCTGLTNLLYIPDGVTKIGNESFRGCTGFSGLVLSDALQVIGSYAFFGCTGMEGNLILPDGLTLIYDNAFRNCSGLTGQLEFPATVEGIGQYAFSGCSGFTGNVVIPEGVTYVHYRAFADCTGLDGYVKIPYTAEKIDVCVFQNCSGITAVYLPTTTVYTDPGIKTSRPFYGCTGITDVYYGGDADTYKGGAMGLKGTVHYNSYPAKELTIYGGGSNLSYRVGQTVTLEATYAADEIAEDLSFAWSSSHPEVVKLVDSTVEIKGKGYAAKLTATFEILQESSAQITVSGPFSLKDDCVVSGTDSKELTFIPKNDQSAVEPNVMQPGDTMEILFSYRSYSPVAEDLDEFTWKTLVDGVEQSGIVSVSNVQVSADGEFAATLTATVTALDYGGPVEVQVSGPGDCKASCTVSVPKDRLIILQADGTQADNEGVIHLRQKVAEPFTFYVRYETKLTDEAQVAQAIESMVWEASTADFFDYDETEHILGNATVFDPEVTWKKLEDGVYQLQTELTPALEGVTALKVRTAEDENGVFTDDVCLVYATFDVDSYLAELYERDLPEAEQLNRYLYELDAPSQLIVDELEKDLGFIGTVAAWEAMEVVFHTIDNPAAAYMKYSVRESDIYYAMLLELLRGSVEEYVDLAAMQATEYGGMIAGHIPDAALMISSLDITESNAFSKWLLDDNGTLCRNTFQQKMEVPGLINDFMSAANVFVGTVNDYGQAMANAAILEQTTDAMERVLEAMLAECPATAEAFHEALERCLEQVRKTGDELRQDAELGLIFSAGKRGYQAVFDKVWDGLMDDVKWADPEVAVIYATYQLFSTLSKEIANTDESVEVYYKMLVLEDIREVAVKAAETLQWVWHEDPGSGTAAEYMCALDMLYRVQKVDLQTAQAFAQALIDAPEYNLSGDPAQMEAALESFKEYGTSLDNTYRVFRDMWMTYFREDYPNALLDVQYEDLFAKATGMRPSRVVIVACPVSVQVLDRYGKEAAYVGRDRIASSTDEISVALIGEEKHIYLYGSGYTLRYEGYDEGTMDVTDRTYNPDGTVKQELQYRDLPVKAGETYKAGQTGNLRNPGGSYVAPHVDSGDYAWTLTVENGAAEINGLPAVTGQVHEGVLVSLTARAEMDGKPFLGWTSTAGEEIFADPASPVTTVVMPGRDVVITAVYGQPKPEIAGELELTVGSGDVLDAIPAGAFTAKVPMPEEAVRGLLAAYDTGGKLVWIGEGAVAEGICTFTADNARGDMAELRFFALTAQDTPAQKTVVFPKK